MITNDSIWGNIRDRTSNDVWDVVGHGAPLNGVGGTGANITGPGSTYIDLDAVIRYTNKGTKSSPNWINTETQAPPPVTPGTVGFNYQWIQVGGTTQADAPPITVNSPANILLSGGNNFAGARLPPAKAGNFFAITCPADPAEGDVIYNVWPASGDKINNKAVNAAAVLFHNGSAIFMCPRQSGDWWTIPWLNQ